MDARERGKIHDVFLSFRGEDTRHAFISHLHNALSMAGIQTFMDDLELQRGRDITESLLQAIESSRYSIAVLSTNYAGSRWCLDELEKIMECRNDKNISQGFVPVFYHVEPSHVRHQKGNFGEAFENLIKRISASKDRVQSWRNALTQAASLSGWTLDRGESEVEFIRKIVQDISDKVDNKNLFIADYPVGIGPRIQNLISKLQSGAESKSVLILGLWGMGGIGKTTIAKAIFNALGKKFNHRSFIANIREAWKYRNGQDLQEQLIFDILGETNVKINCIDKGKNIIKERLHHIKALVLLDDVNDQCHLKALCGNRNWFGPSSIIIITTRDVSLLDSLEADYVHKTSEMENSESLELFSWHAFMLPSPTKDFIELSRDVVGYCGGLPLALEVLGSYLSKRPKLLWEDILLKLKQIPNEKIQEKLKLSFDGLSDHMEKDIFLDICCFFIGKNRNYVTTVLNGCGLHAGIGITILIERSLVKVNQKNKLEMHDLLRDMGREIIREKSPEMLGEHSRLWFHKDALDVLSNNIGTIHVKGLALNFPKTNGVIHLPTNAFKEMKKLKLLQLNHVELDGNYDNLLEDLRWICWKEFSRRHPPQNFYKGSLVVIDLRHNNLKEFWNLSQFMYQLKILNLSHSPYITETPDFSYMPNLERIILKDCPSLSKVHQTIGNLNSLHLVNFKDCECLSHLPKSFYKLKSLEKAILSGSKIDKLEEDIEQMDSLKTLMADKIAIKKVPFSVVRLKSLEYISLCGYEGFPSNVFPSLIRSWISPLNNPRSLSQAFDSISPPISFGIQNNPCATSCLEIETTSSAFDVSNKEDSTPTVSHNQVDILNSEDLISTLMIEVGKYNILQRWSTKQSGDPSFLGDKHADWPSYTYEGERVFFKMPHVVGCNLEGMILCIDYSCFQNSMPSPFPFSVLMHNNTKGTIQLYKRDAVTTSDEDQWQAIVSNLEPDDEVEVIVVFGHKFSVKKTTIYLVLGESIDRNTVFNDTRQGCCCLM